MFVRHAFLLMAIIMICIPAAASAQSLTASDAIETTANGTINWTVGEMYAIGIGAPPARPANPGQARAMAERAAFLAALRNLLEVAKGVQVDSESVVENFIIKSDVIRTKVDGVVKGARVIKTQYMSDGSVEVLVGLGMKGAFMNALVPDNFGKSSTSQTLQRPSLIPSRPSDIKPAQPAPQPAKPSVRPSAPTEPAKPEPGKTTPAPRVSEPKQEPFKPEPPQSLPGNRSDATVAFKGGIATGLVIDGRGLGLRPALLPRIVDEQGREVYVGQVVTRTNAVEQGVAGYAKDVNAAANNFRVTDNPAIVKGLSAAGASRSDIVIGQADAQALRQLSSKGDFLQYCRVIIVY